MKKALYILFVLFAPVLVRAQTKLIVDANGNGSFKTIQEAVNSLPDSSATDRTIFVKNGTYRERLVITKPHVVLQGESRQQTIVTGSMANLVYQCEHPGDRNLGIVTVDGDDVTLKSITIENTYGRDARDTIHTYCYSKITQKTEMIVVDRSAHQFALYSSKCNRLKVINCIVRAWGNDTVSPWNAQAGMYYFKDCILQGGTDFYCPRGWAYADNCTFISLQPSAAAIWHDGHADKTMKSVFMNCSFTGPEPYKLGRYHHDALFYLVNCKFDANLKDLPIYKAETAKQVFWGPRAYFYNCRKEGPAYAWLNNNLDQSPGAPDAKKIDARWTFDGKWDPTK